MKSKAAASVVAIMILALLPACGGSSSGSAQKSVGAPAALDGTTWKDSDGITYAFKDATNVDVKPPTQGPTEGTYTVDKGDVSITAGMIVRNGKWDGKTLTLDDKPLTKQ